MIDIPVEWMTEEVSADRVERVVDAIHSRLEGCKGLYPIVQLGDLFVELGLEPTLSDTEQDRFWIPAIYSAVRRKRISLLYGDHVDFAGDVHQLDVGCPAEQKTLLASAMREPVGRIAIFVILRDW